LTIQVQSRLFKASKSVWMEACRIENIDIVFSPYTKPHKREIKYRLQ